MQKDGKKELEDELDKYLEDKGTFTPYYPGMNILSSALYKEKLEEVLEQKKEQSQADAKSFGLYLDTIIINMHTKVKKYKKSIYFDNENIKDIENQGYTIVFYIDENKSKYILLSLLESKIAS